MTEGQWLYMVANISLDDDEEFEKLCGKCQSDADIKKCVGCGKEDFDNLSENNPNFDESIFEKYKAVRG
jgi:hypothetical protein